MYQPIRSTMAKKEKPLQIALKLMVEAVSDEKHDELFYEYLISLAPTKEEKDIIASIRDDERKHNKMFRMIYKNLTGRDIPATPEGEVTFEKPASYLDGIRSALFGELKAVEKYRIIMRGMPTIHYRDMLFEIITDELKHASKYNYLFALNKDAKMSRQSYRNEYMGFRSYEDDKYSEIERNDKDFNVSSFLNKLKELLDEANEKLDEWQKSQKR